MTVHELNRDQMLQLKQDYLCNTQESVSWGELADADSLVSDTTIMEEYGGINFVPDDFWN